MLTMVKNELTSSPTTRPASRSPRTEIDGGGLRVTTTFTQKAMAAAEEGVNEVRPEGKEFSDKDLHIGVASVQVDTGAVRGIFAGQDFLDSQINWAVAGGQAGSSVKPFALAAGIKAGYSLKDTFDGNSPFELENGDEIRNEGDNDYGSAVNLIKATEDSINTAFTDLTVSMPDGPQKILEMMNAMGIPPNKGPGKHYGFPRASAAASTRTRASRWAARRSARSTWPTATRPSPTAAGSTSRTSSRRSSRRTARSSTTTR